MHALLHACRDERGLLVAEGLVRGLAQGRVHSSSRGWR